MLLLKHLDAFCVQIAAQYELIANYDLLVHHIRRLQNCIKTARLRLIILIIYTIRFFNYHASSVSYQSDRNTIYKLDRVFPTFPFPNKYVGKKQKGENERKAPYVETNPYRLPWLVARRLQRNTVHCNAQTTCTSTCVCVGVSVHRIALRDARSSSSRCNRG